MKPRLPAGSPLGREIVARAFRYSCSFFEYADKKFPVLAQYRSEKARGAFLEAAIIVAALIMMERRPGGDGREALHLGVARSFAPNVAHQNLSAIRALSGVLLGSNLEGVPPDAIPSFQELAGRDDASLKEGISSWLIRAVSKKRVLDADHSALAAAMGRSAWTSATMIVRALPA